MTTKFVAKLSGDDEKFVMQVINDLRLTKEEFAANAIRVLASELHNEVMKKQEAINNDTLPKVPKVKNKNRKTKKVQPPSNSSGDTKA